MDFDVFATTLQINKREARISTTTSVAMETIHLPLLLLLLLLLPLSVSKQPSLTCTTHSLTAAHNEVSAGRHTCNLCIPGLDTSWQSKTSTLWRDGQLLWGGGGEEEK